MDALLAPAPPPSAGPAPASTGEDDAAAAAEVFTNVLGAAVAQLMLATPSPAASLAAVPGGAPAPAGDAAAAPIPATVAVVDPGALVAPAGLTAAAVPGADATATTVDGASVPAAEGAVPPAPVEVDAGAAAGEAVPAEPVADGAVPGEQPAVEEPVTRSGEAAPGDGETHGRGHEERAGRATPAVPPTRDEARHGATPAIPASPGGHETEPAGPNAHAAEPARPAVPAAGPAAHAIPATPAVPAAPATGVATRVDAPAPAAPAHPAPPVHEQLVSVVEPLRTLEPGNYDLTLELRPAHLGTVRVTVSLHDGVVHLAMRAEQAGTDDLLRQTLPELRAALVDAGLSAGDLGVGHGSRHGQDADGRAERGPSTGGSDPSALLDDDAPRPDRPRTTASSGLDLLL